MERYKRLNRIVSLVENEQKVLDIGTDHCMVPILLLKSKKVSVANGSDSKENPITNGKKNLKRYHLENRVKIYKSDGLKNVDISDYDLFIIAGMGGNNIAKIISYKKINQTLILNPTNNPYLVRKTLQKINYKITYEEIVVENNINNLIIKAVPGRKLITKTSKIIGPYLKRDKSNFTHNYYQEQLKYYEKLYNLSDKKIHQKFSKSFKKGLKWKERNL